MCVSQNLSSLRLESAPQKKGICDENAKEKSWKRSGPFFSELILASIRGNISWDKLSLIFSQSRWSLVSPSFQVNFRWCNRNGICAGSEHGLTGFGLLKPGLFSFLWETAPFWSFKWDGQKLWSHVYQFWPRNVLELSPWLTETKHWWQQLVIRDKDMPLPSPHFQWNHQDFCLSFLLFRVSFQETLGTKDCCAGDIEGPWMEVKEKILWISHFVAQRLRVYVRACVCMCVCVANGSAFLHFWPKPAAK